MKNKDGAFIAVPGVKQQEMAFPREKGFRSFQCRRTRSIMRRYVGVIDFVVIKYDRVCSIARPGKGNKQRR